MAIDLTKEYDIKIQYPPKTFTGDIQSRVIDVFIWNGNAAEIDSSIKLKLNGIRADGGVFPAVDVAQGSDGHWKIEIPKEAFEINGKMFAELALSNGTIHKGIDVMEFEVKLTHFNKKISETAVYKSVEELAALIEKLKTDNQAVMDSVSAYFTQLQAKVTNGEIKLSAEADWNKLLNKPAVALKSDIADIQIGGRNYIVLSKLSTYSTYNSIPTVSGTSISTTFTRKNPDGTDMKSDVRIFTLRNTGFTPKKAIYTLSGYVKINGSIPTRAVWVTGKASTAEGEVIRDYYDETTGKFIITQMYTGADIWIIHKLVVLKTGDIITLDELRFEDGRFPSAFTLAPEDLMPTSFGDTNVGGIKYPNGSMVQWKKITGTTSTTANTVSKTTVGAWPTAFATLHSKQLDVNSTNGAFIQSNLAGTTNTAVGEVSVASTGTSVPYEGYIVAYGTWR